MKNHSTLMAVLIGSAFITAAPWAANAEQPAATEPVVVETAPVSTYLNGGVGKDEQAAMRRVAKEFPLRMEFSERKDGEFILDVPVVITNAHGTSVFELSKAGPMLYVMLPNGKYKVSARFKGLTESQEVTVSDKEGKYLSFHWKGTP